MNTIGAKTPVRLIMRWVLLKNPEPLRRSGIYMKLWWIIFVMLGLGVSPLSVQGEVPCREPEPLFAGEYPAKCLRRIVLEDGRGMDKGPAMKLMPDRWTGPSLRLSCSGKPRRDFSPFFFIEFLMRSATRDAGNPFFHVGTWNRQSRAVPIKDYVPGGVIDDTFRLVRIPLADLKTEAWDLGNVEFLAWNADPEQRVYYVDRIALRQEEKPVLIAEGMDAPFPESSQVLRVTLSRRWHEPTIRNTAHYALSSETDPEYTDPVHPVNVGLRYRVRDFSSSAVPRVTYSVFLHFPQPLKRGGDYTLHVKGIADEFCNIMEPAQAVVHYDDQTLVNGNIKINQEGYLCDSPKTGYVGGYLGDLGGGTWAADARGSLYAWTHEKGWKRVSSPVLTALRGIGGIREDRLFCVGDGGVILCWDGASWNRMPSPTGQDLLAVHFGPTGIGWAVGTGGVSLRYDRGEWTLVSTPSQATLRGVWVGNHDTAWAVGDRGTVLSWDGSRWLREVSGTELDLYAISGHGRDQLWAVGANGTVLSGRSGKWNLFEALPETAATLRAIEVDRGGSVWIGGDNGILLHKRGFGQSGFQVVPSGTSQSLSSVSRQHARCVRAVGSSGTSLLLSSLALGWRPESPLGQEDLCTVFALPYGALRLPENTPEAVIREVSTGKPVMAVPLKLAHANWELSGEDVYSFDFSALQTPGTYRAFVPGIGVSYSFKIGDDALNRAAYVSAHAFYYQRCGTALNEPYAEKPYIRALCHEHGPSGRTIDAAFHESLPRTLLYAGEKPGAKKDGHGGWHDAGDYGKYVPTAAAALWHLFTAYDMDPTTFPDKAWNIPESGNGIPDLLDEARWELDWLMRMQSPDGGVYHKLTSQKWFQGMPHEETSPRYFFERTTHDTASTAAVFAGAARLWRPFDKAASDAYLERALKAWAFLTLHPRAVPDGGFRNPSGNTTGEYRDTEDVDNRLWAAAELYRTTGKAEFKDYFESWWSKSPAHSWGWNDWQHFYRCAYWAYMQATWPDGDAGIRGEIRKDLTRNAERVVSLTYTNPYRNGARLDVPDWIGWGAFTQSTRYAFLLLQAWSVTGDRRFRTAALLNLDAQLGAHPLSLCFITGLGSVSPSDPLHLPSVYDRAEAPVPGLPIFGPAAHLPHKEPYYAATQKDDNSFPYCRDTLDPYPILRRFIDSHKLVPLTEFTIVHMAVCTTVFHLLRPASDMDAHNRDRIHGTSAGDRE